MMDDNELRRRFAQLRESDRERVPAFARPYQSRRARPLPRAWFVKRARVIGVAAAVAFWMVRWSSFPHSGTTPAIVTWRAPTDVLLDTPGSELLGTMPALSASILDKMIPTHSMRGS